MNSIAYSVKTMAEMLGGRDIKVKQYWGHYYVMDIDEDVEFGPYPSISAAEEVFNAICELQGQEGTA